MLTGPHPDAEKAFVLHAGHLLRMRGRLQTHIMRIAFERPIVVQGDIAENAPPHQVLRKFKRTVLHQFGIQTAIGTVINIFKEMSVHRRLYLRAQLMGLQHQRSPLLTDSVPSGSHQSQTH